MPAGYWAFEKGSGNRCEHDHSQSRKKRDTRQQK